MGGIELVVMIASKCGAHKVVVIFDLSVGNYGTTPNDSSDLYGDKDL